MNRSRERRSTRRGEVFVSAGAGTGKTSVLVERFVRAVCDEGLDVESVLVITYTRKAAGELRARIRAALHARGRHDLARQLDGAWISTIHGFCSRLLRAHPFAVGIDPRFRELDDEHGAVIRGEAFERALAGVLRDPRLRAAAAARDLRRAGAAPHADRRLRDAALGRARRSRSSSASRRASPSAWPTCTRAAQALAADPDVTDKQLAAANAALALRPSPEQLLDLSHLARAGDRAADFRRARDRLEQAAFDELAARDRELLQELLDLFAAEYAAGEGARVGARLRGPPALRARSAPRPRRGARGGAAPLPRDHGRRVPGHEPAAVRPRRPAPRRARVAPDVFFVGDEFQSIYGFRHADVAVFRERRERAALRLPLSRNYRSRPEVLAAVNHLFSEEFGDGYQPLAASGEFPDPVFGHPVELLVTDKRSYREAGEHWRDGEARAIARRVRELVDNGVASPGEIVLLFAAGTDAERYEAALRGAGPADVPRHGPRLLRPAAGRRPARVPAPAAQPLRRRGARHGARVAVRRRVERRARADPAARRQAAALHRRRALAARAAARRTTSGSCARSSSATSGSSPPRRGCRSSGSARRSSRRTTTTWRCSPSGTDAAATRTCAS